MRVYFFFLSMALSSYICAQQEAVYTEFKYPDGQISSAGYLKDGKPDGFWQTYFPNGILKSAGKRSQFELDSLWSFYDENAKLVEQITYSAGQRHGLSAKYKDGNLVLRCDYIENKLVGICQEFDSLGVRKEVPFVDGKQEGKGYGFDNEGNIITVFYFKDGFLRRKENLNRVDKIGRKQGLWKTFFPLRTIQSEGTYVDDVKHGLFKTYDESGNVLSMEKYTLGELDEGASETTVVDIRNEYYADGRVKSSGSYLEGQKHGIHRDYDEEGNIIAARIYEAGLEVGQGIIGKSGKVEGPWTEKYSNGTTKEEGVYKDGLRTDKWKFYHEDGNISQKGSFRKGKPHGEWRWYYPNGSMRREENYRNGREDGESIEYDEQGEIISKGTYIDGLKDGAWYYHIGDHTITGSYVQGEKDGEWLGVYDNGKKHFKGKFQNGFARGKHKYYFATGQLKQEGKYNAGRKDGEWLLFDEDGDLVLRSQFENGKERRLSGVKIIPTYEELGID